MADLDTTQTTKVEWTKHGTLAPGTRIQIIVGGQTLLDRTVPLGKNLQGTIIVQGELKQA